MPELWPEFQELGFQVDGGKFEAWHTPSGYRVRRTEAYRGVDQADRFSVSGLRESEITMVVNRISVIFDAKGAGIPYDTHVEKTAYRFEHGQRYDAYLVGPGDAEAAELWSLDDYEIIGKLIIMLYGITLWYDNSPPAPDYVNFKSYHWLNDKVVTVRNDILRT